MRPLSISTAMKLRTFAGDFFLWLRLRPTVFRFLILPGIDGAFPYLTQLFAGLLISAAMDCASARGFWPAV